jgi:hypothetical protein
MRMLDPRFRGDDNRGCCNSGGRDDIESRDEIAGMESKAAHEVDHR